MFHRLVVSCFLIASLCAVGCGGDDEGDDGGGMGDAPVADFTFSPNCTSSATDPVTFTSTSTDTEDGTTLECSWTFSSGTPSSSVQCEQSGVTFPNANPYSVRLQVTDSDGNTDSLQMMISPC